MRVLMLTVCATLLLLLLAIQTPGQCSWTVGNAIGGGFGYSLTSNNFHGVYDQTLFDDGTGLALYAAGVFGSAGGVPANKIAKWDGTTWSTLGGGLGQTIFDTAWAIAVFDDGTGPALYVGGVFQTVGGVTVNNIARWDGTAWLPVGGGVTSTGFIVPRIHVLEVFDDGTGPALYAGGQFESAGGVTVNNIAKWDGSTWSALGSGMTLPNTSIPGVHALKVFDDGSGSALYAGGSFPTAGGVPASAIARWDGTAWSSVGGSMSSSIFPSGHLVYALEVFDDGTGPALFAGGNWFNFAGGVQANRIAKWNGSVWSPLGSGTTNSVETLGVFDDGTGPALYAGGLFTTAGGIPATRIARWNGAAWSSLGISFNAAPKSMCVFENELYVGGEFAVLGGQPIWLASLGCGSSISVSATQPGGPGTPVWINNTNLATGNEYFNLFSIDPCPAGPGTGAGPFGACITSLANIQSLTAQILSPVGNAPFHVIAPSSYTNWGPFSAPPMTLDAICIEVTGGVISANSSVARIVVQ